MDQRRVGISSCAGQRSDSKRIDVQRSDGIVLCQVDEVVRGAVDDHVRRFRSHPRPHANIVGDVEVATAAGDDLGVRSELVHDGRAELSSRTEHEHLHTVITLITFITSMIGAPG